MAYPHIGPPPGLHLLSSRAFKSCINPHKRARAFGPALKRADEDYSDYLNAQACARPPSGVCMGSFWDADKMKLVRVRLGVVTLRTKFSYVPASPLAALAQAENLSRVGAGPYVNFSPACGAPAACEDAPQAGENSPGPYVIPGQVAMGCQNTQKMGGQMATDCHYEWSAEKCVAELC